MSTCLRILAVGILVGGTAGAGHLCAGCGEDSKAKHCGAKEAPSTTPAGLEAVSCCTAQQSSEHAQCVLRCGCDGCFEGGAAMKAPALCQPRIGKSAELALAPAVLAAAGDGGAADAARSQRATVFDRLPPPQQPAILSTVLLI